MSETSVAPVETDEADDLPETAREIEWAGGTHIFDLCTPAIISIMEGHSLVAKPMALHKLPYIAGNGLIGQFGNTSAAILKRFELNVFSAQDVECIIELGLWGGGDVNAAGAVALVDKFVRGKPLAPSALLAHRVLAALFVGAATTAVA